MIETIMYCYCTYARLKQRFFFLKENEIAHGVIGAPGALQPAGDLSCHVSAHIETRIVLPEIKWSYKYVQHPAPIAHAPRTLTPHIHRTTNGHLKVSPLSFQASHLEAIPFHPPLLTVCTSTKIPPIKIILRSQFILPIPIIPCPHI